ncbi:glycerophosphoryl diester phosphodiesterase membrane domain-containing protein [Paraclostridium bifermentans]|uniref:glycerophosphoryl diester phosphodiesterase membrane domain-containing protein n=1 Tax=Paraclostridium bifermentans TaxID=1490 RepID=UPI00359C2980
MNNKILNKFILITKYNFGTLILFQLFHKLIVLLMVPIYKYIFDIALMSSNIKYLNVDNAINLLTNPISLILIIVILVLLAFIILFEFVSMIICFNESFQCKNIGLLELVKISISRCIQILKFKNISLIIFVLLIIPLTNLTLTSTFIGKLKLPDYIQDYINSSQTLSILYFVVMLILYILVIRWIFSINEIVLSTNSFKEARENSKKITKGKYIKIILISVGAFIVTTIIGYIIYNVAIILIGLWTKYYIPRYYDFNTNLKDKFINRCFMFNEYAIVASMIFNAIISFGVISSLYYEYKGITPNETSIDKNKKPVLKSIFKLVVILILFQIESLGFSYLTQNDQFNTSFFYNTTATGHRIAAARAPENTVAALKEAINGNAKYIEIDVQETKDGELIVIHDSNFKRTTGVDKNTWEVNYDEVKTYDAGSYFSSDFAGEKIPTLQEIIDHSKGKTKLVIEIKLNGHEKGDITKKVLDVVKANNIEKQCIIASMDKNVLKRVKQLDPNMETCYLTAVAYGSLYDWDYVDIYGIESTFANKKAIEEIHNKGKKVFVWTVNNSDLIDKLIDLNVDSIITDNPYLVEDSIYWKKNGSINKVANILFTNNDKKGN